MKFSGVACIEVTWLVLVNFFLGGGGVRTNAQSSLGRTWPGSCPFPWSLSVPWSLVLPGRVIPFWKALDEETKCEIRFLILGLDSYL